MSSIITFKSDMRVIGGIHRGRRLRTTGGLAVRPTSDRLRETLFNVLGDRIKGSCFLDICAGSGAVGIEALSRGAGQATFIDRSRASCAVIDANLSTLGLSLEAIVINRDAAAALNRLDRNSKYFDIVFFDPPYSSAIYDQVMHQLGSRRLLFDGSLVIVEHLAKAPPGAEYGKLRMFRLLKQGESALAFYEVNR
ncbi:MAG: 16S rRNA (guanine(966)-N(2))-methyltransferase RsmD [Blastocatellia bacterium]